MHKTWVALAVFSGSIVLSGCMPGNASKVGSNTLRFAYNISSDDMEASKRRISLLQAYLERALKMKVDMVVGTTYGSTVEAMRAKRIDAATLGPMAYLLAAQKAGAEAIAMPGTRSGGPGTYESSIVVRAGSPIQSIDELLTHAEKYTFAFVDPASTSGHLIPRAYLEGRDFSPEKRFRKVHFANDHLTAAYTVLGSKVDAGAMMPNVVRIMESKGKIKAGDLRFLWVSEKIPQSPLAVRKDLPVEWKERIRAAFLGLADADPVLAREMQVTTNYPDFCYYPATDATYDGLRQIARSQKTMRVLE
jgi:phosphonate transport system substrate-binding protein